MIATTGKLLLFLGVILVVAAVVLIVSNRFPWIGLGRLPGDIVVKRENFSFYFPIVTCILVSVLLTLVFWLVSSFVRR